MARFKRGASNYVEVMKDNIGKLDGQIHPRLEFVVNIQPHVDGPLNLAESVHVREVENLLKE